DAWRARGRRVRALDRDLFVVDDGPRERPTVLLLHGFPTSSWDWAPMWPELEQRYRVVAFDFVGFGFSEKPPGRVSVQLQADVTEALVASLGLGRHHVLAHDYGDTVAQELLARDRERREPRIASALFLNGGLFPETHRARPIQRLLATPLGPTLSRVLGRGTFGRRFSEVFGPNTKPSREELDAFWGIISENGGRRIFAGAIGYMAERVEQRARWVGALTHARCPLGLINGSLDPVSGAHMVARYREVVGEHQPDTFFEALPDVGHYPQWEAPEATLRAFHRFLENIA
ncbi:MAG: alpha/beta hydrolase, partial [Myxococcota bacterium]